MADYSTSGASRTITAFFDTRDAAERAAGQLASIGIGRDRVRITEGASASTSAATDTEPKGFWEELKDLFLPEEDRDSYAEGLRRGGYLLSARVDDANYNRALEALDDEGAVNMDERESNWRSSGWSGYQTQTGTSANRTTAGASSTSTPVNPLGGAGMESRASSASAMSGAATSRSTELRSGQSETIPVYEETARVGKRDISHGRVRLRSYVVETPVNEQVNLRNEQVQVERRPVDRPVASGDAAFRDRVIEAEERVEAPVVSKETRIKEEVGLRKTVENQTQTVSDTVRQTKVEVQDERTGNGNGRGFATSGSAQRIADHMQVIAADGAPIGEVDHLEGNRIKLSRSKSPDGQHHFIPLEWVDHVDSHVHLKKSAAEARASW